jgi:3'-phosphoadenosine 5'-phosphosulfate sulfotransferase (PAPS reductase)/FAD synthetase
MSNQKVRHILSLSGGKDSTALAIYMLGKIPDVEYAFCDTGEELPETYEYLEKLEAFLGQKIERLNPDRPFTHYLDIYRGVLPDARTRWCTRMLKIKPFENYVGTDKVVSYIAIRADEEHRKGYISTKTNIEPRYPFIEDGLNKEDVIRILEDSGLGIPEYYNWRSRSGCYFCFFQQRIEWVGLLEKHPDLFEKAADFEKSNPEIGERFTWVEKESLRELAEPSRVAQIKHTTLARSNNSSKTKSHKLLDILDEDDDNSACLICHL